VALTDKRREAERLYVQNSLTCPDIAAKLKVNENTVYRWKSEAARNAQSEGGLCWDTQRQIYNMSPLEMTAMYAESIKTWLVKIKSNPELLSDPKVADAIAKHVSVLQKIDVRSQYLGVALDLIKVANAYLMEHAPELKTQLEPYWEGIYQELTNYATRKGVF